LAELKLIRAMQKDVKDRADVFRKKHPELDKLTNQDKLELKSIIRDQKDVADLVDEFRRAADEAGDPKEKEKMP
jgi:hypothetical protein